jgi:Zn-finger nucleic acid-binding protein
MDCPKDKATLETATLDNGLNARRCASCAGVWLAADDYLSWQAQQEQHPQALIPHVPLRYSHAPLDDKAAQCPQCGHYLARGLVAVEPPFTVERCANCGGIWCDSGEWEALHQLGLHTCIQHIFSSSWQAQVREAEHAQHERSMMIEHLGPELATQVFEVAEALHDHPEGYFGVAYLMRRLERHAD